MLNKITFKIPSFNVRLPATPAAILQQRASWCAVILFALLFMRGALELFVPKKLAMIMQLGGVFACSSYLFSLQPVLFGKRQRYYMVIVLIFFLDMALSGLLTSAMRDFHSWVVYVGFDVMILLIGLLALRDFKPPLLTVPFQKIALALGWILLVVSVIEQLGMVKLKGSSELFIIRPASLTGSFLHFPLVMALLSYIMFEWARLSSQRFYLFSAICFFLSPILSASRSGAFIGLFAACLYFAYAVLKGRKGVIILGLCVGLPLMGMSLFSSNDQKQPLMIKLINRVVKAGDMKDAGNSGRVFAWKREFFNWWDTNLFIGEQAGQVTNSTAQQVRHGELRVAESGVLQQLVNFGLIGLLSFYGLLVGLYRFIHPDCVLLRCVYIAAFVQTFFYQSIEAICFIVFLFLFPWVSQMFVYQSQRHGTA